VVRKLDEVLAGLLELAAEAEREFWGVFKPEKNASEV
jgi:hypothetical protein